MEFGLTEEQVRVYTEAALDPDWIERVCSAACTRSIEREAFNDMDKNHTGVLQPASV